MARQAKQGEEKEEDVTPRKSVETWKMTADSSG
jgi:hypothetical protein